MAHKKRLAENGIQRHFEEIDTTCCSALQDKFWVNDPDGNEWEFFFTKADVDFESENASSCCAPQPKNENDMCCTTETKVNSDSCCS